MSESTDILEAAIRVLEEYISDHAPNLEYRHAVAAHDAIELIKVVHEDLGGSTQVDDAESVSHQKHGNSE